MPDLIDSPTAEEVMIADLLIDDALAEGSIARADLVQSLIGSGFTCGAAHDRITQRLSEDLVALKVVTHFRPPVTRIDIRRRYEADRAYYRKRQAALRRWYAAIDS